tara:strand:+ start:701 stop:2071 length:1371 start_codon:yes stop_codon:yes gene_type:complete
MSEIKVNKISPRTACGTTTLGDSGDSFTIPSGVTITNNGTQVGFGRTGTVDWQTGSIKTGDFTAANGEGYFVNTSSGGVTMTLPASPSAGSIVSVKDYANSFGTNALTIGRNGSNINGDSDFDPTFETDGTFLTLIFVDSTQGWKITDDSTNDTSLTSALICATGGTETTVCTNFKVHTFTGPGTFTVNSGGGPIAVVDYVIVAGGGGGGGEASSNAGAGGGGGGGYREAKVSATSGCWSASPLAATTSLQMSPGGFPVVVGAGGAAGVGNTTLASKGSNSVFSSITSTGGGHGGHRAPGGGAPSAGGPGGSGGGGGLNATGGSGNTPPFSPPQGQNGGGPGSSPTPSGAGGGGAGGVGAQSTGPGGGGAGGTGVAASITSSPVTRSGGGGGGGQTSPGAAGSGGGGGGASGGGAGSGATVNTGGGGGGAYSNPSANPASGGTGGSGIVIIRYKFQ